MSFAHFDVSCLGKSITHTYTPCRLIALQENYLTRFLKRSPQSLLSWSCSLAGCAMQKVFKIEPELQALLRLRHGAFFDFTGGHCFERFFIDRKILQLEISGNITFFSSKVEICPKAWRGHMVNVLGPWWIFSGSFRMYPTDGSQIQLMDLNGP